METQNSTRIQRYTAFIARHRYVVTASTLLLAGVVASGASGIEFKNDYRYFFTGENPQLVAYEALQKVYTKNDNVLIVVAPKSGRVFEAETLDAVEALTERAWKIPFASRVDSVTNFQHTNAEEDDLHVADLVPKGRTHRQAELRGYEMAALGEPLLVSRLISADGRVTAVNVQLELKGERPDEATESAAAARQIAAAIEAEFPGIETHITGMAMLSNAFFEASMQDMSTLIPLMYAILLITLLLFLRSGTATATTLLVIALSAATGMGFAGWMGIPITPPSAMAPTMILTLAVADSVHILVTLFQRMRAGDTKHTALTESLRVNIGPVFLTTLTTAIGMLSMNFSDVRPFRDLGNIATVGVAAAFVYSVVLFPAIISIVPLTVKVRPASTNEWSHRLAEFVIRRRTALLVGALASFGVLTALVPQNELNDQFVEYFDDSFAFRRDTDFTTEHLTGIYQLEFSLRANGSGGISEPAYLAKVEAFSRWFKAQPGVMHVSTLTDTMKRLSKNMHGDDPAAYRIPETRDLSAQYLLLYEMSLPFGLDLNNQIDVDKSATRFTVTTDQLTATAFLNLAKRGEAWLENNTDASMHTVASSTGLMFAQISGRNIRSMLTGTLIALGLISIIMGFALRSAKYGALSLLPNLVPAAAAFGLWALIDGRIDLGLSVVATVSLGIVVDDSVHFLSKYVRARRERGVDALDAIRYAFSTVGSALVVTSFVLVAGFMVLSTSPFGMNSGMGLLTAITLVVALVADLLFLPPLLAAFDRPAADQTIVPAGPIAPAVLPDAEPVS